MTSRNRALLGLGAVLAGVLVLGSVRAQRAGPTPPRDGVSCGDPKVLCDRVWQLAAQLNELNARVVLVKADVLKIQIERQTELVARLETDIDRLSASQKGLEEREAERQHEIQELDEQTQRADVPAEQKAYAETQRAESAGPRLFEIDRERSALRAQDEELRARLEREQSQLKQLQREAAAIMEGGAPR